MLNIRLILFCSLVLLSCSRKIVQTENKNSTSINKYTNFSPVEFADALGNLQCEYHHLSFEIIKGNSDDVNKAEKLSREISDIFHVVQNKYTIGENADSASFLLFQKELRMVYDSCIKE